MRLLLVAAALVLSVLLSVAQVSDAETGATATCSGVDGEDGETCAASSVAAAADDEEEEKALAGSPVSVKIAVEGRGSDDRFDVYWDNHGIGVLVGSMDMEGASEMPMGSYVGHSFFLTKSGTCFQVGEDVTIKAKYVGSDVPVRIVALDAKSASNQEEDVRCLDADDNDDDDAAGKSMSDGGVELEGCGDVNPNCRQYARGDGCNENPGWMAVFCAKTCNFCEYLDPLVRCNRTRLNMTEETFVHPGYLDSMFESLLERYADYEPTVLSSPPDGPWIIQLENFVAEDEIKALIETTKEGFRRSTDSGKVNKHGVQEKVVSQVRTSTNAWCRERCENHPKVKQLTAKIEDATGIPEDNYETYQVLNYEIGQFYRTHHDMGPSRKAIDPAGPRVLTFFLYLSDVEEGGETHFPKLDLSVKPKRGRAILWPSVLNDDPERQDPRTSHQAKPVIKGFKVAANAWIHGHNFKTPNHWGCTGAFN